MAHQECPKPPTTTAGAELLDEPPPTLHLAAATSSVGGPGAGIPMAGKTISNLPLPVPGPGGASSQTKVTMHTLDEDARKKV